LRRGRRGRIHVEKLKSAFIITCDETLQCASAFDIGKGDGDFERLAGIEGSEVEDGPVLRIADNAGLVVEIGEPLGGGGGGTGEKQRQEGEGQQSVTSSHLIYLL
jgi:hypothetical protein